MTLAGHQMFPFFVVCFFCLLLILTFKCRTSVAVREDAVSFCTEAIYGLKATLNTTLLAFDANERNLWKKKSEKPEQEPYNNSYFYYFTIGEQLLCLYKLCQGRFMASTLLNIC